jgi:hypothetical protein
MSMSDDVLWPEEEKWLELSEAEKEIATEAMSGVRT